MSDEDPGAAIVAAVADLARRRGVELVIEPRHRLAADLGLESLDIAELVAVLELELDADPFVESASIADARSVGDLIEIYRHFLALRSR